MYRCWCLLTSVIAGTSIPWQGRFNNLCWKKIWIRNFTILSCTRFQYNYWFCCWQNDEIWWEIRFKAIGVRGVRSGATALADLGIFSDCFFEISCLVKRRCYHDRFAMLNYHLLVSWNDVGFITIQSFPMSRFDCNWREGRCYTFYHLSVIVFFFYLQVLF